MAKQKKKTKTREELDKLIEQRGLEKLQEIYGNEEGEKRYREIQEKVKAESERDRNETWHDREERKKQERIGKWIRAYKRMTMAELLGLRDLFEKNVKTAAKEMLHDPKKEEEYLEAKAKYDAIVHLINHPEEIEVKKPEIKEETDPADQYMFSEFKESYLKHVKTEKAPKTLESVERVFKHFENYFGDKPLGSFVPEDLEHYKESRKDIDKVSDATINSDIRTIKAAFQKAVDWERLKVHPFRRVGKIRIAEKNAPSFTKEEFKKLCITIDDERLLRIVKFAVLTGMRRGEIVGLIWRNVDIDNKKITVVSTEEHRVKHGQKRKVPINSEVAKILDSVRNESEYVFLDKKNKPYNGGTITKKFKDYVRSAGLSDELHFHSLRATFTSWLISQGATEGTVQKLLGHKDIKTTQSYSTYDDESLANVVSKINLPDTVEKEKENQ